LVTTYSFADFRASHRSLILLGSCCDMQEAYLFSSRHQPLNHTVSDATPIHQANA
jgi:hypothetical protein